MIEFWKITAAEPTPTEPESIEAEILLFSPIGDMEDMGQVGARKFAQELHALPKTTKRVNIHINSPGGSIYEANAIYSTLADYPAHKTVYIDGIAASAASLIAMVGHEILMRENANIMIHLPRGLMVGNAEEMRHAAASLDVVTESMLNVYARKTKLDREEIRDMMKNETWFTAQQAKDKGFADDIRGVIKAAASIGDTALLVNGETFDLAPFKYQHVPQFPAADSLTTTRTIQMPTFNNPVANGDDYGAPPPGGTRTVVEQKNATTTTTITDSGSGSRSSQPPVTPANEPRYTEPSMQTTLATASSTPAQPATASNQTASVAPGDESFQRGIQAERTRIAELELYNHPSCAAIVAAAKADGRTAAQIAADCFKALAADRHQNARYADASGLDSVPSGDAPRGSSNTRHASGELTDEQKAFAAKLKEKIDEKVAARRGRSIMSRASGAN